RRVLKERASPTTRPPPRRTALMRLLTSSAGACSGYCHYCHQGRKETGGESKSDGTRSHTKGWIWKERKKDPWERPGSQGKVSKVSTPGQPLSPPGWPLLQKLPFHPRGTNFHPALGLSMKSRVSLFCSLTQDEEEEEEEEEE
ncbi:hypothetical protein E2I00_019739, partial [Balaenoptera physalus]